MPEPIEVFRPVGRQGFLKAIREWGGKTDLVCKYVRGKSPVTGVTLTAYLQHEKGPVVSPCIGWSRALRGS